MASSYQLNEPRQTQRLLRISSLLYRMRIASFFTINTLLKERLFKYMHRPLYLARRRVLYEKYFGMRNRRGLRFVQKWRITGVIVCKRSRAIRTGSSQWPSHTTTGGWRLVLTTRPYGSGTPRQVLYSRRSRAIRTRSTQWPFHTTTGGWHLVLETRPYGSGMPRRVLYSRRSRIIGA
jgi:hypothetical protein